MNCPTCKNAIQVNSTVCEWCGVNIEPCSNKSLIKNSNREAKIKALRYTIYFVLIVFGSTMIFINDNVPFLLIFICWIIPIELYIYLKNRFSK
jgi:hypothetical protein